MFGAKNVFRAPARIQEQHRHFFAFLNFIFNRVSASRIKEVGADRACAEWLMRNGAHIRWKGEADYLLHYNNLPLDPKIKNSFHISHVKAHDSSINSVGFLHFNGCKDIIGMEFHKCSYFDDKCINLLSTLKETLKDLKITSCYEVSDKGLQDLLQLQRLESLALGDLEGVKEIYSFSKDLEKSLPNCKLEINQPPINPPDDSQKPQMGLFTTPK